MKRIRYSKDLLLITGILLLTAFLYHLSLSNGFFCWDDKTVALAPFVRQLGLQNLGRYFTSFHAGLYHPLTTLSFACDYAIGKGSPFPFHITNLVLHLLNTILTFILVRKLFNNRLMAFWAAILMGIHPLHVEAVAWITSRKDLLYVLFFLASLISYTHYLDQEKKRYYFFALLLFLFSSLSKIQGVILPFVLFLIDYLRNKRMITSRSLLEKAPFLVFAIIFGIVNLLAQRGYGYLDYKADYSLLERTVIFCYGFARYISLIIFPFPDSVFYPFPFKPGASLSPVFYLYPVVLAGFFAGLFVLLRKDHRQAAFGLMFYFLCILLVLLINNYRETVITDRYTYLGSAGLFIFLARMGICAGSRFKTVNGVAYLLAIMFLVGCSYLAYQRNRLFHHPRKLMESALSLYRTSPVLLNTLGSIAIDSGDYSGSLKYLDQAISFDPGYAQSWYNRGIAETKLENYSGAVRDFSTAIRLNPAYPDAFFGRGNTHRITGNDEEAMKDYSLVIFLEPGYFGAWQNRAIVKGDLKDFRGALQDLNQAIRIDPSFGASWFLRGIARFELGENGCEDLRKAISCKYGPAIKALEFYCK